MITKGARWLVPALASLVLLSACGTAGKVATLDSPAEDASTTPVPSLDPEEAIYAFAECMREHGIDVPDPQIVRRGAGEEPQGGFSTDINGSPNPPDFDPDSEEFQAAMDACRDLMGGFAAEPGDAPQLTEEQEQAMLDFAECMRDHGIDMPDPQGGGFFIGVNGDAGDGQQPAFDPQSEEFTAAEEACRPLLGEFAPTGGGPRVETNE
jgi:hypothetical protein